MAFHYETNKISAYMRAIGKLEDWRKWYVGQTGAIIEGKFVVDKTDVERVLTRSCLILICYESNRLTTGFTVSHTALLVAFCLYR